MQIPNTTISFIANVNEDAKRTFRKLAAIGFAPNTGLNGQTFTRFYGDKKSSDLVQPDGLTFGLKFAAMKDMQMNRLVGSFMLVRADSVISPLNLVIPMSITAAIPADIDFPQDGHLRWRTSAPIKKGNLFGFLTTVNQCLEIDTNALKFDSNAIDMQVVYAASYFYVHILTAKGTVYETRLKPNEVITNGRLPNFHKISRDNVTALLTVPHKGEMIAYFGTAKGIYFGDRIIPETSNLNIVDLVVDSENPRIFARTNDGKIFSIPVDGNFIPTTGKLIAINDIMKQDEQLYAGPGVKVDENMSALLAIQWEQQGNGFSYTERTIALPLPIDFPIERTPPRNPRL